MAETRDILVLEQFLPYRLSVLTNIISNSIAATYGERFGLTIPGWRVMAVLGRFPGLSAAEVAQRTAMDKVAVSRAVSQLLHAERLERRFADDDRRRSELRLSAKGREIYDQVVPLALDYERALLASLSAEDRRGLDHIVGLLTDRAQELARS